MSVRGVYAAGRTLGRVVACNGDSIMYSFLDVPPGRLANTYPMQTRELLGNSPFYLQSHRPEDGGSVFNVGRNSRLLGGGDPMLPSETLRFGPSINHVHICVNDIQLGATVADLTPLALAYCAAIEAAGAICIWDTVNPCGTFNPSMEAVRVAWNAALVGGLLGPDVLVCQTGEAPDLQDVLNPIFVQADEVHPTELGAGVMAALAAVQWREANLRLAA